MVSILERLVAARLIRQLARPVILITVVALLSLHGASQAAPITIDFNGLAPASNATAQSVLNDAYAGQGVTFDF